MTVIELNEIDLTLYEIFLKSIKGFKNGSITLHFDSDGKIRKVEQHQVVLIK